MFFKIIFIIFFNLIYSNEFICNQNYFCFYSQKNVFNTNGNFLLNINQNQNLNFNYLSLWFYQMRFNYDIETQNFQISNYFKLDHELFIFHSFLLHLKINPIILSFNFKTIEQNIKSRNYFIDYYQREKNKFSFTYLQNKNFQFFSQIYFEDEVLEIGLEYFLFLNSNFYFQNSFSFFPFGSTIHRIVIKLNFAFAMN